MNFPGIDPSFLELIDTNVTDRPIQLDLDQTRRNYLHAVAGSEAAKIGAGLFIKPAAWSLGQSRSPPVDLTRGSDCGAYVSALGNPWS